jgi:hypothetical protein
MAYTNVWSNAIASDSTVSNLIDDRINRVLIDVEQRMDDVLGNTNWTTGVDPVVASGSRLVNKPNYASPNVGLIPKVSATGPTALANSLISESGGTIIISGNLTVAGSVVNIRSIAYTFPVADGSAGFVLQTNGAGALTWVSVASAGGITGAGTAGRLTKWSASDNVVNSLLEEVGNNILPASDNISDLGSGAKRFVNGTFSSTLSAGLFNGNLQGNTLGPIVDISGASTPIRLTSTTLTGTNILTISENTPTGNPIALDLSDATGAAYRVNGTKVLGPRITGWQAWTGTPTRTALDTSETSLQNVNERIKALIDDLFTHGILGT